ncbi:hypothetical protein K469DRAFT_699567 [Zopfia rhizophila CBS 207.26]|uniref:Uncharacterized protein n=1 Tax=Zopfia rhizophila CBS 207.26 TaxID=1314779 RepID=A0A6A6EEM5_9PEZI|nr:hypothetical protein K469DRAFT_699567 [Zopfia rhizophila CBS 207.26]
MSFGVVDLASLHPHSNIATYYGCLASDGRVISLCFKRYLESLLDKINPDHLNKSTFILSEDRTAARKKAARYLPGIENGIRHLHAHGRNHNHVFYNVYDLVVVFI